MHGKQSRDWVHTADTCRALDLALHTKDFDKIKNQVINVGSGRPVSIADIAKVIVNYFNLPEDEYIKFIGDRPGQVRCHVSSTQKAKDVLDWEVEISFEEGLRSVIKWYVEHTAYWENMEIMKFTPIYTNGEILDM